MSRADLLFVLAWSAWALVCDWLAPALNLWLFVTRSLLWVFLGWLQLRQLRRQRRLDTLLARIGAPPA